MITDSVRDSVSQLHPKLARNRVWCITCGKTQRTDCAENLSSGWPKCCNQTMTLDSPEERRELDKRRQPS